MRKLFALSLLMLSAHAWATTYSAGTAATFLTAAKMAAPGDVLTLTADMTIPPDTLLPAGVTLDLGGKTVSAPAPTTDRPQGYRLFDVRGGGITVRNGTIDNAQWGLYTFYSCKDITVRDVTFTNVRAAALKLSALKGSSRVDNIVIENVIVKATGRPQTLIDLGPGAIGQTLVKNVSIAGPVGAESNTACDGLAIEDGQGPITIESLTVDGVPGDGCDVKNSAPLTITNLTVTNATRNGVKVWCHSTAVAGSAVTTATLKNVTVKNCGLEHLVVAAGTVTIDGLAIEAPGAACGWGGGLPYPADITVKNGSIVRTGTSSSWLMFTDGGDSRELLIPAKVRFENVRLWGGATQNLLTPKTGSPVPRLTKDMAMAGQWPANFINCTYAETGTVTPPVIPPPPSALEARVAALESLVETLAGKVANQTVTINSLSGKWSALAGVFNDVR